jgi:bacillithiol biosynthesis deacetylase BshB1
MNLDAVFFGAHPDDAELSCGGTIIKLVESGKKAGIIDLTRGELGTRGTDKIRTRETKNACKILGVKIRDNLGFKDTNIENTFLNRLKIIKSIRKYRPKIIFLPYPSDRHPDHIHTSITVKESAFYAGLAKLKTRYNGKTQTHHRPEKMIYYMQTYTFEPSFIVDITEQFEKKMKAVKCYYSQFYNKNIKGPSTFISDKKFIEYIEARAAFYGFQIGVKYGEPFYMEEKLKIDPFQLL